MLLRKSIVIFIIIHFFGVLSETSVENLRSHTPVDVQRQAAEEVIQRLVPNFADRVVIIIEPESKLNSFTLLKTKASKLKITASDGVSACKGFNFYLKHHLGAHISWDGNQLNTIQQGDWPDVSITSTSSSRFIYYQNVCTWGYSFTWWTWKDWRRHIDWMALMGINLSLAPIQEEIWYNVYKKLGLTEEEILDHFTGPAFLPWQRMGNVRGWGGPLTSSFRRNQFALQKQIVKAQRELGMMVALPAMAGHVPTAFPRIFPNSSYSPLSRWNRFSDKYCCPQFLDSPDKVFQEVSSRFIAEVIKSYGTDHIYFADPYNEVNPAQSNVEYISLVSKKIYESMASVDPKAVWLLQAWFFANEVTFWKPELKKAFLTSVPKGSLLVLDLHSELAPQYENTNSYFGQPFIWCMLHNFGGTLGMHGSAHIVNTRIQLAKDMENSTMVGVGITPEGIDQNYVMYELALERGWQNENFNLEKWFQMYATTRYGVENKDSMEAWLLLLRSVYDYKGLESLHGKYLLARRPSIKLKVTYWYNTTDVEDALQHLLNAKVPQSTLYAHDLIDVVRQYFQNLFDSIYKEVIISYTNNDISNVTRFSNIMLELLTDLDEVLRMDEKFLLGKFLISAKLLASNPLEEELFEFNARNQVTTWGPNGEIVDYATKQWAGMVGDYFYSRWALFTNVLKNALSSKKRYNENQFRRKVFNEVENPFTVSRKVYTSRADKFSLMKIQGLVAKWKQVVVSYSL